MSPGEWELLTSSLESILGYVRAALASPTRSESDAELRHATALLVTLVRWAKIRPSA